VSPNQGRLVFVAIFGLVSLIAAGALVPAAAHRGDALLILLGVTPSLLLFWWWQERFEWPGMVRRSVREWFVESDSVRRWTGLCVATLFAAAIALGEGWIDAHMTFEGKTSRLWFFVVFSPLMPGMLAEWFHRYRAIGKRDGEQEIQAQRMDRERAAMRLRQLPGPHEDD